MSNLARFEDKMGDLPVKNKMMSYPIEDYTPPYSQSKHDLKTTYCWDGLLSRTDILAAPVKAFRHVSLIVIYFKEIQIIKILFTFRLQ